jgi:hypothetical protein
VEFGQHTCPIAHVSKKRKAKMSKNISLEGELYGLLSVCELFLSIAKEKDDFIASWIKERGIKEVSEYMEHEIKTNYVKKGATTYALSNEQIYNIMVYLRNVYLQKILGEMVEDGYLTEDIDSDGSIRYTRTDKKPPEPPPQDTKPKRRKRKK